MFTRGWNPCDCENCRREWKNGVLNRIRVENGRMGMNIKILAHSQEAQHNFETH